MSERMPHHAMLTKMIRLVMGLSVLFVMVMTVSLAHAEGLRDSIVSSLARQGYSKIVVSRTFLGRTRILATRPGGTREIVFNPYNDVILRDYMRVDETWDGAKKNSLGDENVEKNEFDAITMSTSSMIDGAVEKSPTPLDDEQWWDDTQGGEYKARRQQLPRDKNTPPPEPPDKPKPSSPDR